MIMAIFISNSVILHRIVCMHWIVCIHQIVCIHRIVCIHLPYGCQMSKVTINIPVSTVVLIYNFVLIQFHLKICSNIRN